MGLVFCWNPSSNDLGSGKFSKIGLLLDGNDAPMVLAGALDVAPTVQSIEFLEWRPYWRSPEKSIGRSMIILKQPLWVRKAVFKLLPSQVFFPWCTDRSNWMRHNIWYGPGDPEVCQSWALSIDSLIVRLLGSRELTHNQRLPSFLRRNKIRFLTYDMEGRLNPWARSWCKSSEFLAPPSL